MSSRRRDWSIGDKNQPRSASELAGLGVPTFTISSPDMHPFTSVLLANTSKLAPERRCINNLVSSRSSGPVSMDKQIPLPGEARGARLCSLQSAACLWHQQPRLGHLSFQNNFSSMTAASFVRQRPLERLSVYDERLRSYNELTYIEFVTVRTVKTCEVDVRRRQELLPFIVDGLYDEA